MRHGELNLEQLAENYERDRVVLVREFLDENQHFQNSVSW